VDRAIKEGTIKDAGRPPDFASPVSEMGDPVGARFVRNTKNSSPIPLILFHHIYVGLWGPLDVGDRTSDRFAFAAIDRATGHLWIQPVRARSEALAAMRNYPKFVNARFPDVEQHMEITPGRTFPVRGLAIVPSDRGGEWAVTRGATRPKFEEFMHKHFVYRLSTPKTPKSGTTRIEGAWRTIVRSTQQSTIQSGSKNTCWWDAMVLAVDVYNNLPTKASALKGGVAPNAILASSTTYGASLPSAPPPTSVLTGTKPLMPCRSPWLLATATMGAATAY